MLVSSRRRIFPCFLLVREVLDISSGKAIASHWLEDLQTVRQQQRKATNVAPPTFSEALAASQKK
jgi:hypothetical protein